MDTREITLHGHRVSYRTEGEGEEVVVLIHGITGTGETWAEVIPVLAEEFTVVAPDLLGHGHSAKPRGDYSLGAYASGVRDLVAALGHDHATVVGHSLGGGVAMQLAYQFPERCDRLVLVSSGGLGREVNLLLRAAALPGAEFVLPLVCAAGLRDAGDAVWHTLGRFGLSAGPDLEELWNGYASLADRDAQSAFIPVEHGIAAHEAIPGSRLEVFEDAGHFPHRSDPVRFAETLIEFVERTVPADVDDDRWRELLRAGAPD